MVAAIVTASFVSIAVLSLALRHQHPPLHWTTMEVIHVASTSNVGQGMKNGREPVIHERALTESTKDAKEK